MTSNRTQVRGTSGRPMVGTSELIRDRYFVRTRTGPGVVAALHRAGEVKERRAINGKSCVGLLMAAVVVVCHDIVWCP